MHVHTYRSNRVFVRDPLEYLRLSDVLDKPIYCDDGVVLRFPDRRATIFRTKQRLFA